jgi:Flp pilus assembly protein TadG
MKIRDEKGGSLIEFAVIAPLLFVIVFGIIEFGLLFYDMAMITNASREGARSGIVFDPALRNSDGTVNLTAVSEKVNDVVDNYCSAHLVSLGGGSSSPSVINVQSVNIDGSPGIQVNVTYPYQFLVFRPLVDLMMRLFSGTGTAIPGSITLPAETVMRLE